MHNGNPYQKPLSEKEERILSWLIKNKLKFCSRIFCLNFFDTCHKELIRAYEAQGVV
jgi:hypothetical protein